MMSKSKRIISAILGIAVAMQFGVVSAFATPQTEQVITTEYGQMIESDGIKYMVYTDSEVYVGSGESGDTAIDPKTKGVVTIPDTITADGKTYDVVGVMMDAFAGIEGITEVVFGNNVTDITVGAFDKCYGIEKFSVDSGNEVYTVNDGVIYAGDETILVKYPLAKKDTHFFIDEKVHTIYDGAFDGNKHLMAIEVSRANPNYIATEGVLFTTDYYTMVRVPEGKSGMVYVYDNVKTIADGAFYDADSVVGIYFDVKYTDILMAYPDLFSSLEKQPEILYNADYKSSWREVGIGSSIKIVLSEDELEYTGKEQTVTVEYIELSDMPIHESIYTVIGNTATEPGDYLLTIKGNELFDYIELRAPFSITKDGDDDTDDDDMDDDVEIGGVTLDAKVNKYGNVNVEIGVSDILASLKATAEEKITGFMIYLDIDDDLLVNDSKLNFTISAAALKKVKMYVDELIFTTDIGGLSMNSYAIEEVLDKTSGKVTFTIKPVAKAGQLMSVKNAIDDALATVGFEITAASGKNVISFGKESYFRLLFPFSEAEDYDDDSEISIKYINSNGKLREKTDRTIMYDEGYVFINSYKPNNYVISHI